MTEKEKKEMAAVLEEWLRLTALGVDLGEYVLAGLAALFPNRRNPRHGTPMI